MTGQNDLSLRQLRVGEELRHVLAEILGRGGLRDRELFGRIFTVTEVRPSPDLKRATVYLIPLGGKNDPKLLSALNRASSFMQQKVGRRVRLKFVPRLLFSFDNRFDYASKIDGLLRRPGVARDLLPDDSEYGKT